MDSFIAGSPYFQHVWVLVFLCRVVAYSVQTWTPSNHSDSDFTHMQVSRTDDHLYVAENNKLYDLNTTTMELVKQYVIESGNPIAIMIINGSQSGQHTLFTCTNNASCYVLDGKNVPVEYPLSEQLNMSNAAGFIVQVPSNYLFVASLYEICKSANSRPGIYWYGSMSNKIKFKKTCNTNIFIEEYVAAFEFQKFRLFFSVHKGEKQPKSKLAQICQRNNTTNDNTHHTYVDMPIICGRYNILTAVSHMSIDQDELLVASFTDTKDSAVCWYTFEDVKERFAENVKQCYKGIRPSSNDDYIDETTNKQCTTKLPDSSELETDVFLCNTIPLETHFNVVGNISLNAHPVLEYKQHVITAVTLTNISSKIIAFLGTKNGYILKAVIYPNDSIVKVNDSVPLDNHAIRRDMFTSRQDFIYAFTKTKVAKIPLETCSVFKTCDSCLGRNDPYCGWCMLENRCSIARLCNSTVWLSKCARVVSIEPSIIDVQQSLTMLKINVTHAPKDMNISCVFHNDDGGTKFMKNRTADVDDPMIYCKTPEIDSAVEKNMKGYINVTLSLYTPISDRPIMEGELKLFKCSTFTRCDECVDKQYNCTWCLYNNMCVVSGQSCGNSHENESSTCPEVRSYFIAEPLSNNSGVAYMDVDQDYNITATVANFVQPRNQMTYACKLTLNEPQLFSATFQEGGQVTCHIDSSKYSANIILDVLKMGTAEATLTVLWRNVTVTGEALSVVLYNCTALIQPQTNCGKCQSFKFFTPYYQCQWCDGKCVSTTLPCPPSVTCPDPDISTVFPLKGHVNSSLLVEITGLNLGSRSSDIVSVRIAGEPCTILEERYKPSDRIECRVNATGEAKEGTVDVSIKNKTVVKYQKFIFLVPEVLKIEPTIGPISGGTEVYIFGKYLEIGRFRYLLINSELCEKTQANYNDTFLSYKTCAWNQTSPKEKLPVGVQFDGAPVVNPNVTFTYVADPTIISITPRKSFRSGGRRLTINGTNLNAIQHPKVFFAHDIENSTSEQPCSRNDNAGVIYCPSPPLSNASTPNSTKTPRTEREKPLRYMLAFMMDDVKSVSNLSEDVASMTYYIDPEIWNLTNKPKPNGQLEIMGKRLGYAATIDDVDVKVGCGQCNVTSMNDDFLLCQPPQNAPICGDGQSQEFKITVTIGYLKKEVGEMDYSQQAGKIRVYVIVGVFVGVFILVLLGIIIGMLIKRKRLQQEKKSTEKKMEKLEITVRKKCREEFAALQTTIMSDLTCDFEGGSVLFRDFNAYACKTLCGKEKSHPVIVPPVVETESSKQAMDAFKNLLGQQQFLLMLIKLLESQPKFSVNDRSHVATLLMVINQDDMVYITRILISLLNDLIDKSVAANTEKLLLRRSMSVSEKLLTHWLSICLYDYLKERTGSVLYILYKAIKIQVEMGPVDYITGCAKNTLSEDKLFRVSEDEINPQSLNVEVRHFDYKDNKEKKLPVPLLDCDTITQAKNKMLDLFYKNVPYSERPSVHRVVLEVQETEGTTRLLHDEDVSSVKDGTWIQINTLNHYAIRNGAVIKMKLNREIDLETNFNEVSPDSYIGGSLKKAKSFVRTISGSHYWHLRTLQKYIDDLFSGVLFVEQGTNASIIIKYLFDFLEGAAVRCNIVDPDVVHMWKCNSLLLRFWVNIIKNPEFLFDIHKPKPVDCCLSVIAQTFMDSCSTTETRLGASSPSNKLLFTEDIPRYKVMVKTYLEDMHNRPAISDQDLNSYLTQNVSKKFSKKFDVNSALLEMYEFAYRYQKEILSEMDNSEAALPGTFSPLSSKLQYIYMTMDKNNKNNMGGDPL